MKKIIFVVAMSAIVMNFSACKEDEPCKIPTVPTTFCFEDGAIIEDTIIKLSASGSTVEDQSLKITYEYFIGTSKDNLQWTKESRLEPYTQYFWSVKASTREGEGEMSEVRTFYCVPPMREIETDHGDGDWAAVLRFKGLKNITGGTVTATPNHEGYYIEPINIAAGQDSCYIRLTQYSLMENNACVQDFDDEHGKLYEPVIYTFNVNVEMQVGDKKCMVQGSAKEIILNKQTCVRDHEFNVYRIAKIGKQTWLADDLRVLSFFYNREEDNGEEDNGEVVSFRELPEENGAPYYKTGIDYDSYNYYIVTLKNGDKGVLYNLFSNMFSSIGILRLGQLEDVIKNVLPKGYHIATDEDWTQLENYYGVAQPAPLCEKTEYFYSIFLIEPSRTKSWPDEKLAFRSQYTYGEDCHIRRKLRSQYGWEDSDLNYPSMFNAKPFGAIDYGTMLGVGNSACYITSSKIETEAYIDAIYRFLPCYSDGIVRYNDSYRGTFMSIRLVKD